MPTMLGPTLPEVLEARRGIPSRRTTAVFVAVVAALVVAVLAVKAVRRSPQLVHHGTPTFNLVYGKPLHKVTPQPGELARFVAHRPRVNWELTVSPLHVAPYAGDAGHALLPVLGDRQTRLLSRENPGFGVRDEGRAQISGFPGYQIGFLAGGPGRIVHGRDILVIPADRGVQLGVLIRYRETTSKAVLGPHDQDVDKAVRKALRSFTFGTARS